jgi:hypothetical protein
MIVQAGTRIVVALLTESLVLMELRFVKSNGAFAGSLVDAVSGGGWPSTAGRSMAIAGRTRV